jgi:hypothetical protein
MVVGANGRGGSSPHGSEKAEREREREEVTRDRNIFLGHTVSDKLCPAMPHLQIMPS